MIAAIVAAVVSATRVDERDATDMFAEWDEQQRQREIDDQKRETEFRKAMHQLIRARLKYECEFVTDEETIYWQTGAAFGEVIVSNALNAKRRVRWHVKMTEKFNSLSPDEKSTILENMRFLGYDHLHDFSIGGWEMYRDGQAVNGGEI